MKLLKNIFLFAFVVVIIYLAFFIPKSISIDGMWSTTKIVIDGVSLTDTKQDSFNYRPLEIFKPTYIVLINRDSMFILKGKHKIRAKYKIQQGKIGNHTIYLSSSEKALNGAFQLTIDTSVTNVSYYKVYMDIVSNSTQLSLEKDVYVKPWKPRPIERGKP